MKKITTLLMLLMLICMGAGAQITVGPSTGTYMDALDGTDDNNGWAAYWKSSAKAADGSTSLLILQAPSGMDTSNGDIYANANAYTLTAPSGYVISGYTINGTATGGDVTITPAGDSGTTITSGNSLSEALSITVRAQSTTFTLSGSGYIANLNLVVTVSPIPVTIAYCPGYTTSGCSHSLPSAYGTFTGSSLFTTGDASGMAGVTITPSTGLTIGEQNVNVNAYGKCFKLVTSAAATDYTVTLQAPIGYVITGYYLGCSANSTNNKHTLTSADGSVSIVADAPNQQGNAPKAFEVNGLNSQSTYFTIRTASSGNALYLPIFQIYVAKSSEVINVAYNVMFNGSQVATKTVGGIIGTAPALPASLQKSMCTYSYYSDEDCTTPLSALTPASTTVYAKCTYPFTVSTAFNTATWYYLKLKDANYPTYVSGNTPNVTLPTTNAGDRTTQWAFFGNPYDGLQLKNRAAGNSLVLGSASANSDGANGGNTYATLQTTGSQTYERWFPASSTFYTGAFFLNNGQDHALNQRSTANLAYWTGGKDAGSSFVVEAAPSDEAALAALKANYEVAAVNLDKPGFPTTAAYNTFRSTIEAFSSLEQWEEGIADAASTVNASVVYPNGTYYIKNRNTGCYAFITDDGELVPRIKIDTNEPHNNNNYLWTVTSNKGEGTCSIVSSLYSDVPFAKGADNYSNITAGNRTIITTLSTELFSGNNGTSGAFYLNGAHNNNVYTGNGEGDGNSHVVSWNITGSAGSQWIFEPVELPENEYTITVEGLDEGGQDAVTLSDGTIVNLGTGTVYLSETPTAENITQGNISGYSILDGSISIDGTNITITYSPSYDVLIANYWSDNDISAKLDNAGKIGYPALDNEYTSALNGVKTALDGGTYTGNSTNYNNLRTWYDGFISASPVLPTAGFYRIKSSANWSYANMYLIGSNDETQYTCDIDGNAGSSSNSIWYYNGTTLYGYGNGGYTVINNNNFLSVATAAGATGTSVLFQKANKSEWGSFNVIFKGNNNANRYLYTDNGYTNAGGSTDGSYGYNFNIEEVTSLPITFKGEYASFYSPVDLTIPEGEGIKVYTGALNGNKTSLVLTEITSGTLPANTGVILHLDDWTTETTKNFTILGTAASGGTGDLRGTVAAESVEANSKMVLGKSGSDWGIYKYSGNILGGFKAYMNVSDLGDSEARGLKIVFDESETTGIQSIEESTPDPSRMGREVIYDLQGRKVAKPSRGMYIVNGKKVVIK